MLTNISWTDYLIAVAILLAIYYLYVVVQYFSADIQEFFYRKRKVNFKAALSNDTDGGTILSAEESSGTEIDAFEETSDDEFAEVEHLIERLKGVIADASTKKLVPQEFKHYLHLVLKEYPSVQNSPLRSSVNELIVSECEKYSAVTLSEDEVDLLWKDAV
ncbi:MAG: hypothetical protein B7Y11_01415 [Sphingobacteriia bacterium 24-36-13]|jgi:hypothetical protein|uniref:hypothetical protein n=1 Tax=Chitinophagaceae TaxID=563835 RepID=UPI000AECAADB|nr:MULTISPECIES: hypothetical protein [Chitinophagaceae]OYY11603.1 MAG: hypothetical protein B7Y66_02230 [Sphingobacteriia bacterium 35-36-14]OYZ55307.1 MAG: hypothetical protein B7Y11_01415 [Sphingobacteriia bacterium 24-36-13]OZA66267.1 MAG: hypothetical protein B7X68_00900 [Sphingobacteriia bacterium 39-36-14]RWZ89417.1 MAG: hypothetical protein EO766_04255 [Hydrotalea sp. AMD]HQS22844.1 hypothetical protein [Sediminibacterium sp.]